MVDRAVDGDTEAFAWLYERHVHAVHRYALFRVANAAEAEDITQDVFVRAYTGISELQAASRFRSWLFAIAHNCLLDARRESDRMTEAETLPEGWRDRGSDSASAALEATPTRRAC